MYKLKLSVISIMLCLLINPIAQANKDDINQLLGEWQLDMTPENHEDDNFALMHISSIADNKIQGDFYRKGVKIQQAQINQQSNVLKAALISEDNSGKYHSSFYLEGEKLIGTTHAIDRGFLAIWTAKKIKSYQVKN
ncbi:MAG: hypothetical protein AB8B80_08190 [Marinicellaceae bacterium]